MSQSGVVRQILDLARWAPSGDNTQCWRFELVDDGNFVVHGYDTRDNCVYDLDGHPSQISIGALLETIAVAASAHGMRAEFTRRNGNAEQHPVFDVRLASDPAVTPSPLIEAIKLRSVQRRPMQTRPLLAHEKQALEAAVGAAFEVQWIEGLGNKVRTARLMYDNAKLRLTMPEAYEVHRRIIHWGVAHSPDRVPDRALGVDAATLRLMKWAMASWGRLSMMNTLMGTWAPRLQMDFIPGIACAAHFVIKARSEPRTIDDYVAAGRAVQRFWLTLTQLDLFMQPEMTPLIFSKYVREGRDFTRATALHGHAARLQQQTAELIFTNAAFPVFMGRIGAGEAPQARSERRPLDELIQAIAAR
jgi:hypothetical protein